MKNIFASEFDIKHVKREKYVSTKNTVMAMMTIFALYEKIVVPACSLMSADKNQL